MSYNRQDIPGLIQLFAAARLMLKNGRVGPYLCHALDSVDPDKHSPFDIARAKELVHDALGNDCYTLDRFCNFAFDTIKNRKAARIRWCNKIIRDLRRYQ